MTKNQSFYGLKEQIIQDKHSTHLGIPALPFSRMTRNVSRPKPRSYPKELKTIGDHIRAWRIDNYLLQKDVARILSVCEDTVTGWEMRGTIPLMRQMPEIIKMIGYFPPNLDTSTSKP